MEIHSCDPIKIAFMVLSWINLSIVYKPCGVFSAAFKQLEIMTIIHYFAYAHHYRTILLACPDSSHENPKLNYIIMIMMGIT